MNSTSYIARIIWYCKIKLIERRNNAEIGISFHDKSAEFAGEPFFPHGLNGIIISRKSKIGKNAVILHQVTIGTAMIRERAPFELAAPKIGNNVYIGAGAKVIGDIFIGNNVIIGANAVVTKNVPDDSIVIGNPSIIKKNNGKYNYRGEK